MVASSRLEHELLISGVLCAIEDYLLARVQVLKFISGNRNNSYLHFQSVGLIKIIHLFFIHSGDHNLIIS